MKWVETTFGEFVNCNPKVKAKKGSLVENCEMEDIVPGYKYLHPQEGKIYDGGNSKFQNGDTVFARITPCLENGKIAQIKDLKGEAGIGSTEFFVFRGKKDISDSDFVYYLSKSHYILASAVNSMVGASGRQRADLNFIKGLKIKVPKDIQDQQKLASILSRYDDLIEVNNRRIALLEASARELYKEWFVRFRFPGYETAKFVDGLPEGWKKVAIGEVVSIIVGGDKPVDCEKQPTSTCTIPVYANGETDKGLMGYTSSARVTENCVTVSARGNVGFVCLRRKPFTPIVRLLAVIPKAQVMNELYLYQYLKSSQLFATGAAQQQITAPLLNKETIIVPRREILFDFFKHCNKFYNTIEALEYQNSLLSTQRDRLLPRLLSGDLSVD